MKPVLYRYKDTESVIKVMDGYTPGEGWEPLYSQDQISSAVNAALKATAPDERVKELEAELAATEIAIAEYRQQCLDNAAEIARLRSESEERLQNCAALVAENEQLRKDAERYQWLAEYLVSDDDSYDDAIVAATTVKEVDSVIDNAMGASPWAHCFCGVRPQAQHVWQAATDAALERAAEVCVDISAHQLTFQQRKSAATCAAAIRALKESKE
jgi:hypothetical protein